MQNKLILTLIAGFIFVTTTFSQQTAEKVDGIETSSTSAVFLGKTKPLKELIRQQPTSVAKKHKIRASKKRPENFKNRRGYSNAILKDREFLGNDPIRQSDFPSGAAIEPLVNIVGIGEGGSPLDPTGNAGNNYYIQMVNVTQIGVFSKSGELIEEFSANTLWDEIDKSSAGDPIVLFDELAQKWIITEFTDPANLLIAVTETDDPFGSYFIYTFATPEFPDYPKYAIWPDAIMVTTNEEGPDVLHHYFIQRAPLLAGEENVLIQRVEVPGNINTEAGFFVATPVDWNGSLLPENSKPLSLSLNDSSWGEVDNDQINLFRFDVNWNEPDSTTVEKISIITTPFDGYPCAAEGFWFACMPQKGGTGLDGIPEVIMNVPDYRNFGSHESMVFSFITDVTDGQDLSGIRWVELRRETGKDWYLYQEGSYAPEDGYHRFMSSIVMDDEGNIAMGFNVTSENDYVGVRYTGRFASDPLGVMTVQEYNVVNGQAPISSGSRFGDYAHMSLDPADGKTFWYTTEYAGEGDDITQSRIIAFQLLKDTFDLSVSLIKPASGKLLSAEEDVVIRVKNSGLEDMSGYIVDYSVNGIMLESIEIPDTLRADSIKEVIFTSKVDLSGIGSYQIACSVQHPLDNYLKNNTVEKTIVHYPALKTEFLDASIPSFYCSDQIKAKLKVKNLGIDTINTLNLDIYVNEVIYGTQEIELSLPFEQSTTFELVLTDIEEEDQQIRVINTKINGIEIENPQHIDLFTEKNLELLGFTLNIKTDEYPDETSWELFIEGSDEPYLTSETYTQQFTEIQHNLCLVDTCYSLVLYDTYGDGFCCEWGDGSYSLINTEGEVILSGNGKIGYKLELNFCTSEQCNLSLESTVTHDHGTGDGTILLSAANGEAPFLYSIDGGVTLVSEPLFTNLTHGTYHILVLSADTLCFIEDSVVIELRIGVKDLQDLSGMKIYPNPNTGYFHVAIEAPEHVSNWFTIQILDQTGRILQEKKLYRYEQTYHADLSLVTQPAGLYYIRARLGDEWLMQRIIKTE